jgi:hypothetical protein
MPSSSARNFNLEPDGKRFAVTNHPQCQEDAEPKNELAIISKNLHLPAFCHYTLRRDFSLWTGRHARSHLRTKLRQKHPKTRDLQSDNRRAFAFRRDTKRDHSPDLRVQSNSPDGTCMLRTRRFLAADKKVLKVRISLSPPYSLNCTEFPLALRRNTRKMPFLRRVHTQSGFNKGLRRMQCDLKSRIRPRQVDF